MTTRLYFRSIHKFAAEQTGGMTSPVHTAVALNTAVTGVW